MFIFFWAVRCIQNKKTGKAMRTVKHLVDGLHGSLTRRPTLLPVHCAVSLGGERETRKCSPRSLQVFTQIVQK